MRTWAEPMSGVLAAQAATPAPTVFTSAVEVLNYALALEHLEATFYREGLRRFANQDYLNAAFQTSVRDYVATIGQDEADHVDTLTKVVTGLGGTPVLEVKYTFGYSDLPGFLKVAASLENTGAAAYTGAVHYLQGNAQLLTAALTIQGVEARHAAYLNLLTHAAPFPGAFEPAKTPAEVLAIARPFMQGAAATPAGTAAPAAAVAAVAIRDFAFVPGSVTVKVGATVTWTNEDIVPHTVTADDGSFRSGSLAQGQSFRETFRTASSIAYHCEFHASMHGTVVVT